VFVDPNGEIVFRHNGPIKAEPLQIEILRHMGRYFVPPAE